jgi:hypothetical protein
MHKHRTHRTKTTEIVGWTGCVGVGGNCGEAHGGVIFVCRCSCGAIKRIESNGKLESTRGWGK